MNFSESRQNRSRENREKSKNRFFFFPPLVSSAFIPDPDFADPDRTYTVE